MSWWEIVAFILIVIVLAVSIWLLIRSEKRTKNKWKLTAYKLLEEKNPDPKKVKETIKFLRIYGGRINKDHEFTQLDILLCDLYREIEKSDNIDKKIKNIKK
jgi:hypothetical protein